MALSPQYLLGFRADDYSCALAVGDVGVEAVTGAVAVDVEGVLYRPRYDGSAGGGV